MPAKREKRAKREQRENEISKHSEEALDAVDDLPWMDDDEIEAMIEHDLKIVSEREKQLEPSLQLELWQVVERLGSIGARLARRDG